MGKKGQKYRKDYDDELIEKVLLNENTPNILYDLHGDYRISKPV